MIEIKSYLGVVLHRSGNDHAREYLAAVAMIEAHAAIWTPQKEIV